jgi:predicted DNA binding protein
VYQSKLFVDLETEDVLSRITRGADRPFAALEEVVETDELITFVVDAREYVDEFEEAFRDSPRVTEVRRAGDTRLLVCKEPSGALPIIRRNHGKLNGIDLIHGTKRLFSVLAFRRADVQAMVDELGTIGTVRLDRLVPIRERTGMLSERQREAVSLAFEEGFYDWPRGIEATDLADRMGIAHSTYLEHLRKAERKLIAQSLRDDDRAHVGEERRFLADAREN